MLAQNAVAGAEELAQAKGKCVHCANAAERICQRCGDFYCSKLCQRQDWQRHRYICIPLPSLVSPNEYSVFQSDGESTLGGACSLNADKSADLQCNNAGSSSIIAAKNDIPVSPPSGVIQAKICKEAISDVLIALPCSSQLVQLKNVLKCDYSNDVIAFNSQFVGKKYMATFKKGPGIHLVELVNTEMNFSVNEQLKAFFNSKKLLRNPKSVAENKKSENETNVSYNLLLRCVDFQSNLRKALISLLWTVQKKIEVFLGPLTANTPPNFIP
ncbi:LOW QUALITY PROTEIN: uncharacterized protein Dsimw501_GD28710 [Drosophila simulans]|nr:LOW QUALITY PROTEIN: uncharacterized protein Dsimw501_GD28710 [Drosophila simulans]